MVVIFALSTMLGGCSLVMDELKNGVSAVANDASEILDQYRADLLGEVITEELYSSEAALTGISVNRISLSGKGGNDPVIKIVPSDENKVVLKYQKDLLDEGVSFGIKGGEFFIDSEHALKVTTECFEAVIYADIENIDISGGVQLSAEGICQKSLAVSAAGAVEADFTGLDVEVLNISVAGAGEFRLSGKAERLSVKFDGAGDLNAKELIAKEADVTVNGAGSVELSCKEKLSAAINGAGNLEYYGSPTTSFSGGGLASVVQKSSEIYTK